MNCTNTYKINILLIISIIFLLTIFVTPVVATSDVNKINDGYLDDSDENGLKTIDYKASTNIIQANSTFHTEIIIANYGTETEEIQLSSLIVDSDTNEEINNDLYEITPKESYDDITLESGEQKSYKFRYEFFEPQNNYTIIMKNEEMPSERPNTSIDVQVTNDSAGISESGIIDRDRINLNKKSIDLFKDEYTRQSNRIGTDLSIPPFELDDNNNIVDMDKGSGNIIDFSNMRTNSETHGVINNSENGNINVGFKTNNVPVDDHYALYIVYELYEIENAEIRLVKSTGEEIDSNTNYYITNSKDATEERRIQLSINEIKHIKSQENMYVKIIDDSGIEDEEIDIYEFKTVSLNDVWKFYEEDISATIDTSLDSNEGNVEESFKINVAIENNGNMSIYDRFRLNRISSNNRTIGISDEKIVNPSDSKTISYNVRLDSTGTYLFNVLNENIEITISEENTVSTTTSNNNEVLVSNNASGNDYDTYTQNNYNSPISMYMNQNFVANLLV